MTLRAHHLGTPMFDAAAIARRVDHLAAAIAADTPAAHQPLVIAAILNGSCMFMADMARALARHAVALKIDFLMLASYGQATVSSGVIKLEHDMRLPVRNQSVLVIDDILDSGRTLDYTCRLLRERGAVSVKTCVLLDKRIPRAVPFTADYAGFEIPDLFVVGYGLDYDHLYRELPFVAPIVFDGETPQPNR